MIFPQLDVLAPIYAGKFRQLILSLVERFGPLSTATYELLDPIVWPKATFCDWFANMTIDKFHAYQRLNILI